MYCKIIPENCIACGLCQVYAPHTFDYTQEGIVLFQASDASLREKKISSNEQSQVLIAYRKCPVGAIKIEKKNKN